MSLEDGPSFIKRTLGGLNVRIQITSPNWTLFPFKAILFLGSLNRSEVKFLQVFSYLRPVAMEIQVCGDVFADGVSSC